MKGKATVTVPNSPETVIEDIRTAFAGAGEAIALSGKRRLKFTAGKMRVFLEAKAAADGATQLTVTAREGSLIGNLLLTPIGGLDVEETLQNAARTFADKFRRIAVAEGDGLK